MVVDLTAPRGPGASCPVNWAIFALARSHRGAAARMLAPLGLAPGQELLLFFLWEEDGVSQKQLIEKLALDHSTVARSIRRMENAGLLIRSRSPQDGRVTLVHLTKAGRALETRALSAWTELEARSTAHLSTEESEQLVALARRVVDGIGTAGAAAHDAPD